MTKKDYEAIAEGTMSISFERPEWVNEHCTPAEAWNQGFFAGERAVKNVLITYFEEDNPRFDKERFLRACGL